MSRTRDKIQPKRHPLANASQRVKTRACYTMHNTPKLLTITNDKTLTPRLQSTPIQDPTGRIMVHTFTNPQGPPTMIIAIYAYQRGHKTYKDSKDNKNTNKHHKTKTLKNYLNILIQNILKQQTTTQILISGDFQHTLPNPLHRTTKLLPPPPHDILTQSINKLGFTSIIPHTYPNQTYLTRTGHKGSSGIDHIVTSPNISSQHTNCGIDKSHSPHLIFSDHSLIYADIPTTTKTNNIRKIKNQMSLQDTRPNTHYHGEKNPTRSSNRQ